MRHEPADLGIALVVDEGQGPEAWMARTDVSDGPELALDDAERARGKVRFVLARTLLVDRDEVESHTLFAGHDVQTAVAMRKEAPEHRRQRRGRAGAAEPQRRVDRV